MGPFELWQAAGWSDVAQWIGEDVAAGRALARVPLPSWVTSGLASGGVHTPQGAYSASANALRPRSSLAVYKRQRFPDPVLGERFAQGTTISETPAVRMWTFDGDVAIVSFKTKANTIGEDVLDGLERAIERAEREHAGLVIWQPKEPFSLGANLAGVEPDARAGRWNVVEAIVARFQATSQRLRYSLVPTVAAVRGMALGGSCEFILHCDRTVAALESYIGLVEAAVGLLPAGAGCKELAVRAAREAARGAVGGQLDHFPFLRSYFQQVAMAKVSKSARNAQELGYLRPSDVVVPNAHEVLHVAICEARALAEAGYRPPLPARNVPVAGATGIATLTMLLVNMRDGGFISAHDFDVGRRIARVLCGGELAAGTAVDERWFLALEREEFMALVQSEKTMERIAHTLKTGKPLRN
jgi:3-hydroxyacyl-CoA dehydrogenase